MTDKIAHPIKKRPSAIQIEDAIRVGRQFEAGRKLGKTHQNVLVFVKGDPRKATEWCGPVEIGTFGEALEGADEVGA